MAKDGFPWYRRGHGSWYVWREGRQVRLHKDEDEAFRLWHRLEAGIDVETNGPTLGKVIAAYLGEIDGRLKPSTILSKTKILRRLEGEKGGTKAGAFTNAEALAFLDRQAWGQSLRWLASCVMQTMFRWAVGEGLLDSSPIQGLKVRGARSRGADAVVQPDAHARLLGIAPPALADVLTALHATGCRPGEVCSVEAKDFDPAAGVWILDHHKTDGKSDKPRVVFLTPEMVAMSRRLAEAHPRGPMFRNTKGTPVQPQSFRLWVFKACRRLGMPKVIPYGYRHGFATDALARGVPDATVAALLGHSGTTMLHKHYSHLTSRVQVLREAATKVRPTHEA